MAINVNYNSQRVHPCSNLTGSILNIAVNTGIAAGVGALAGHLCSINPVQGAIFVGAVIAISSISLKIFEAITAKANLSQSLRTFCAIALFIGTTVAAFGISAALGYPLTFKAGVVLAAVGLGLYLVALLVVSFCAGANKWSNGVMRR